MRVPVLLAATASLAACTQEPCNGSLRACDLPLPEVVFPGAHNAMSNADEGWSLPNQTHPPKQALADGVRALLLDTYDIDGADMLCHSFCELGQTPLGDVLGQLRDFLDEHPREVVILVVQDALSTERTMAALAAADLERFLITPPTDGAWPTLGELIRQDARLLVTRESSGDGPADYRPFYDLAWDTPYEFSSTDEFSCDVLRGSADHAIFQINHWVSTPFPSAENATAANARDVIEARIADCEAEHGRLPTVFAVDYYDIGDLIDVVQALNEAPEE